MFKYDVVAVESIELFYREYICCLNEDLFRKRFENVVLFWKKVTTVEKYLYI